MLASTLLISLGPKPVTVRLCFGRVKPGPTGPWSSASGALVEGLRSRGVGLAVAILMMSIAAKRELLRECRWESGDGGVEGRMAAASGSEAHCRMWKLIKPRVDGGQCLQCSQRFWRTHRFQAGEWRRRRFATTPREIRRDGNGRRSSEARGRSAIAGARGLRRSC